MYIPAAEAARLLKLESYERVPDFFNEIDAADPEQFLTPSEFDTGFAVPSAGQCVAERVDDEISPSLAGADVEVS